MCELIYRKPCIISYLEHLKSPLLGAIRLVACLHISSHTCLPFRLSQVPLFLFCPFPLYTGSVLNLLPRASTFIPFLPTSLSHPFWYSHRLPMQTCPAGLIPRLLRRVFANITHKSLCFPPLNH